MPFGQVYHIVSLAMPLYGEHVLDLKHGITPVKLEDLWKQQSVKIYNS